MRENTDTRRRIQEVALDLFAERGYEATSLREIAEVLGVTKAALYYHFKTKEDIVTSLTQDRAASIQALIDWAKEQPHTAETRAEILRRYSEELRRGRHPQVIKFMERNQAALRDHPKMESMRDRMLELVGLLSAPGDPPITRLRNAIALFSLHAPWFLLRDSELDDDDRARVGLQVALEMIGADDPVPKG
jgi:AcrR family transcriptional regulator